MADGSMKVAAYSSAMIVLAIIWCSSDSIAQTIPAGSGAAQNGTGSFWTSAAAAAIITGPLALLGIIISGIVSRSVAKATYLSAVALDKSKRHSELALKISELVSDTDDSKKSSAMRRFAIGIVKVTNTQGIAGSGTVYFIPMNSRITIGRDEDNDIVLDDVSRYLSRWHCGFSSDQSNVYIDDYLSTNGTMVNGTKIRSPHNLEDGDFIQLDPYILKFRKIKGNSILSQ